MAETVVQAATLATGDRVKIRTGRYGSATAEVEAVRVGERRTTLRLRVDGTGQSWRRVYRNEGLDSLITKLATP